MDQCHDCGKHMEWINKQGRCTICDNLHIRDENKSLKAEVERLKADKRTSIEINAKLSTLVSDLQAEMEDATRALSEMQQERRLPDKHCSWDEITGSVKLILEGLESELESERAEVKRLKAEKEGLKDQNQEIAASNADHVRWHREKEAETERLKARLDAASALRDDAMRNCKRLKAEIADSHKTIASEFTKNCDALARIEAALALHKPGPDGYCTECADPTRGECDTVKALKGE